MWYAVASIAGKATSHNLVLALAYEIACEIVIGSLRSLTSTESSAQESGGLARGDNQRRVKLFQEQVEEVHVALDPRAVRKQDVCGLAAAVGVATASMRFHTAVVPSSP